jgi:glycosyltransferase involved in cell wall biosynthesis
METSPPVSIGMPVYNGEKYLGQALDSLLAQDCGNFELIISDNGSTDNTAEICQEYAKKDKRVRYFQTDTNLGASYNFNRVFELASGEFFMWAGSHNLWTSDYIKRLVNVLIADPQVALAYTETYWIDAQGNNSTKELYHLDTRGVPVLDRIPMVIKTLSYCDLFYGLYRTSVLKKCRLGINTLGFDHILLMEVSLFGEIAEIPGKGFLRRLLINYENENEAKRVETTLLRIAPLVYRNRKKVRAWWEMGWQHVLSIGAAPIPTVEKAVIMPIAAKAFYTRFKHHLWNDLFHPVFEENAIGKREIPNW